MNVMQVLWLGTSAVSFAYPVFASRKGFLSVGRWLIMAFLLGSVFLFMAILLGTCWPVFFDQTPTGHQVTIIKIIATLMLVLMFGSVGSILAAALHPKIKG